jgi:DNA-binding transcriptional LysR family regulator
MKKGIDWEGRIGRRLRLRDLHVLSAAVQSGSMARAAVALGVSQPVVSDAIADLEAAVGVRLLDRSTRGVEPTLFGRALLRRGQVAFDELRQGIKDIEFLADPREGEVRMGCPESISAGFLPPVIERMSREYPKIVFRVSQVNTLDPLLEFPELRERKLDLILARLIKPFGEFRVEADLEVIHLFDDDLVVASGVQSPWARRRKVDLAELAEEPWILPPKSWNSIVVEEAFHALGLDGPKVRVETFSVALRSQLLANGRFITALPKSVLGRPPAPATLKVLPVTLPAKPWPVAMITMKNRTLGPVADMFIQHARQVAQGMNARGRPN